MDPLTIGVLSASVLAGFGGASWAGLKAWNGWLELKSFELTHDAADRTLPPATGGSRSPTFASASASSRRSLPVSTSSFPRSASPQALAERPGLPFSRAAFPLAFWKLDASAQRRCAKARETRRQLIHQAPTTLGWRFGFDQALG